MEAGQNGKRLHNQVAIVTGAGSSGPGVGVGKAIAMLFAREGASDLLVDINENAATETQAAPVMARRSSCPYRRN